MNEILALHGHSGYLFVYLKTAMICIHPAHTLKKNCWTLGSAREGKIVSHFSRSRLPSRCMRSGERLHPVPRFRTRCKAERAPSSKAS
jgi:hypothetical protein